MSDVNPIVLPADARELVTGFVASGFEAVRETFIANISEGLEVGAAFAVTYRGEMIVDLWGGHADKEQSIPLQADALFNLFSTTKGLTATCIALLVDHRQLSYESPVAEYWPEFAKNGKHAVTVGQLMSHQAGLCGPREAVTIDDYYAHVGVASLLADQVPFFNPGSAWGYHALTIGTLADELVRRVDGRTIGSFFADEVATPLGLEAFLGLPDGKDHKQVKMIPPPEAVVQTFDVPNERAYQAAMENPTLDPEWPNSRAWRAAGLAGAGGSADARSLARLYGVLANRGAIPGTRLLSPETIAAATRQRVAGFDLIGGSYERYAAGFQLNISGNMGAHQEAFGHRGWGGSSGFADPKRGIGVAYVMNKMVVGDWDTNVDPRLSRLVRSLYTALRKI